MRLIIGLPNSIFWKPHITIKINFILPPILKQAAVFKASLAWEYWFMSGGHTFTRYKSKPHDRYNHEFVVQMLSPYANPPCPNLEAPMQNGAKDWGIIETCYEDSNVQGMSNQPKPGNSTQTKPNWHWSEMAPSCRSVWAIKDGRSIPKGLGHLYALSCPLSSLSRLLSKPHVGLSIRSW